MNGIIRDEHCGTNVAKMAELGAYDEEFLAYGFSWYDNATRYYFVSSDSHAVYRFAFQKMLEQQLVSPVEHILHRQAVPSGMKQAFQQQTKIRLAKQLQKHYSLDFFKKLTPLHKTTPNDSAVPILENLQHRLEGTFDNDQLHYFEALLHRACISKKITEERYRVFAQWLIKNYKQMEDDIVVEERYHQTMGGFCYKKPDGQSWNVMVNAQAGVVYEEWMQHLKKREIVTPIFWKEYWYPALHDIRTIRQTFKVALEQLMEGPCGQTFLEMNQLPAVVEESACQKIAAELQQHATKEEQEAFLLLRAYWGS